MKRTIQFFLVDYDSGNNTAAHPIYSNDFSIVVERESGQIFFREKLSGNLTFVAEDFTWIMSQGFDAQIDIIITIVDNGIVTKQWHGKFCRTDCTINEMDGIIKVTPSTVDAYGAVLDVFDVEFNLAELPLPQKRIQINVPTVLQIYILGDNYLTNYWQGEVWTTEVDGTVNVQDIEDMGFSQFDLILLPPHIEKYIYARKLHSSSGTTDAYDDYNVNKTTFKYAQNVNYHPTDISIISTTNTSNAPTKYGEQYISGVATGEYYTTPSDTDYIYIVFARDLWDRHSYWIRVKKTETLDIDDPAQVSELYANYTLGDLLRGLISANSLGLTFQDTAAFSQFFYSNPNPVTGWAGG